MKNIKEISVKLSLLLLLIACFATPALAAEIKTTNELISAMRDRYANKWYKTLVFAQKTTDYKPDGKIETGVWYEAMRLPGKLRIDFGSIGSGNGVIFDDGMQHDFKEGKAAGSRRTGHPLLTLGFAVYGQPAETTIRQLAGMKFDLSKFREDVYGGRAVYVVGADKGDLRSRQFWIDKKRLYFLRSIQPAGGTRVQEFRFGDYRKVKGGGWVAARVEFLIDGKLFFLEEYFDIKPNAKLPDGIFDLQNLNIKAYER